MSAYHHGKVPKAVDIEITRLFKKYIVKRPDGNCQALFALTELDELVEEIIWAFHLSPTQGKKKKR